jgi:hypothetical protein
VLAALSPRVLLKLRQFKPSSVTLSAELVKPI